MPFFLTVLRYWVPPNVPLFPEFSFPFNDRDDADFNLAIYEMQNGPVRYDADGLASLSFNPLLQNIRTNLARSFDLDPDTSGMYLAMTVSILLKNKLMTCYLVKIRVFLTAFLYCI